jgi:hypothetical protein
MVTALVMVRISAIAYVRIIPPFPYDFGTIPHGEPGHVPACVMPYHTDDMSCHHQVIPMATSYGARW